jgi:hypothetical protein
MAKGNDGRPAHSKYALDAGGRRSTATSSGRWTKRCRDRRAPEAEPLVCLHAREKARYQAETDGRKAKGE